MAYGIETEIRGNTPEQKKDDVLSLIQEYVLWNAMELVHYANNVRANPDGTKVGGHQASSASIVTIMTSLYFDYMKGGDKISVKPHGSPVYHAIQYLLGNLDPSYMTELKPIQAGAKILMELNSVLDQLDWGQWLRILLR